MSKLDDLKRLREERLKKQDGVGRPDNPPPKPLVGIDSHGDNEKGQGDSSERRPRFDRNAYQREYMRKWRAARKQSSLKEKGE